MPAQDGRTPLYIAAWHGHAEVVRVLLKAGADMDAVAMGLTVRRLALSARSRAAAVARARAASAPSHARAGVRPHSAATPR